MTIVKAQKKELVNQYIKDLSSAGNVIVIKQSAIPVGVANQIRKEIKMSDGKINVIRKRLFVRALQEAGMKDIDIKNLDGSIAVLYSKPEDFDSLKAINKHLKKLKAEDKGSCFDFLGGWFEKKWQSGEYVNDLANLPTKNELISKLLYLFNYPLQSFACVIDQISKKNEEAPKAQVPTAQVKEEVKEEGKSE